MKYSALPIPTLHRHRGPLGNFSMEKIIPPKNVQGGKKLIINAIHTCERTVWQVLQ